MNVYGKRTATDGGDADFDNLSAKRVRVTSSTGARLYDLPQGAGTVGQVVTADGAGSSAWGNQAASTWTEDGQVFRPEYEGGLVHESNDLIFGVPGASTWIGQAGKGMVFVKSKGSLIVGTLDAVDLETNIGTGSLMVNPDIGNIVSGNGSMVIGTNSVVAGDSSGSIGQSNTTGGRSSLAIGAECKSNGTNSFSSGYRSTATGNNTICIGQYNTASNLCSAAIGSSCIASGSISMAIGGECKATGDNSFAAGGYRSIAQGDNSFAAGQYGTAGGHTSTVFGSSGQALGANAFVGGGISCYALGANAHAAGGNNAVAGGADSFATGWYTLASHPRSFVAGGDGINPTSSRVDGGAVFGGALAAQGLITGDVSVETPAIDALAAGALTVGGTVASAVTIAQAGVTTTVAGPLQLGTTLFPTSAGTVGQSMVLDSSGDLQYTSSGYNYSTGVLTGGLLTVNGGDDTKFDISDGTGQIVDPTTGVATPVAWAGLTALSAVYTGILTYVLIDSTGSAVTSSTKPSNVNHRDYIHIGVLVHTNGTNLNGTNDEQTIASNPANQLGDLMRALGFINVSGNTVGPSSLLTFLKASGVMFGQGVNYANNAKDPNRLVLPAVDTNAGGTFQYRYQDGSSSALTLTSIIPGEYDDGNGQAAPGVVPSNSFSVQRFYTFQSGVVKIQPGQAVYATIEDAVLGIGTELFATDISIRENGMLIGYLAVKGNATDLSVPAQAQFIAAGKFGAFGN